MSQSVDAMLKDALRSVEPPIPVETGFSHAETPMYYVFSYTTGGTAYADDDPQAELVLATVHLFAPLTENISKRVKETKRALHDAGFSWPSRIDASDGESRHIVFECEIAEGVYYGDP